MRSHAQPMLCCGRENLLTGFQVKRSAFVKDVHECGQLSFAGQWNHLFANFAQVTLRLILELFWNHMRAQESRHHSPRPCLRRLLEAIQQAAKAWPGTVVPTLLGAHVVPKEFQNKPERYLREVCEKMIPLASKRKLAAFVDIFYERGAFNLEACEQVFAAATQHGLGVRAHAGQFSSAELWPLLRFHPASFDHMDCINSEDIPQLARRDTVVTLLPGSNYFLGLEKFPPARTLIDGGVPVALATDYNPGTSPTSNMQFVLSLACTHMKMTPAEAISAATINGAHALRLAERKGSVEPGKDADLAVFEVEDYREIAYWVGGNRCSTTILNGTVSARNA